MTTTTDIYLAAQDALTDDQRAAFLRLTDTMFPRLRGAHVADVLAILDDNDWACGAVEATTQAHPELHALDPAGVRVALIAANVLGCDPVAMVRQLVSEPEAA